MEYEKDECLFSEHQEERKHKLMWFMRWYIRFHTHFYASCIFDERHFLLFCLMTKRKILIISGK